MTWEHKKNDVDRATNANDPLHVLNRSIIRYKMKALKEVLNGLIV